MFIIPFYKTVQGLPSASKLAKTKQSLPSQPPSFTNITIALDKLIVHWNQIDQQFVNGVLEGYKVRVNSSYGELTSIMSSPADTFAVIRLGDLNLDSATEILVEVAAVNKAGTGPFSTPVLRHLDLGLLYGSQLINYSKDEGDSGSVLMGALLGSLAITLAIIVGVVIFFRQRFSKHQIYMEKVDQVAPPDHAKEQSLWIDQRWTSDDSGEGSNASDKQLLGPADRYAENEYACIDRPTYATSYGMSKQDLPPDLAPYASTDILRSQLSGSIYNNRYIVSTFYILFVTTPNSDVYTFFTAVDIQFSV